MLPSTFAILTAFLPFLSLTVNAAHNAPPHLRHRRLATALHHTLDETNQGAVLPRHDTPHAKAKRAITGAVQKRGPKQQCRVRNAASSAQSSQTTLSSASSNEIPEPSATSTSATVPNQEAWAKHSSSTTTTSSTTAAPSPSPTTTSTYSQAPSSSAAPPATGGTSGLLDLTDGACGWCSSSNDAPNGSEDWLNCGLSGDGWNPPHLTLDKLIYKSLSGDGVFAPCQDYFWAFEQFGAQYGVPPILLASFAMQESTCNPSATGGNGEAGLMQIAQPNCGGAPGGNCYDIAFNVERGAKLFSDLVNSNNGNVLIAAGGYNGWRTGMTANDGMAAKWQGNCHAQNNLDYLHQLFNGWIQGRNGYSLGSYFNLKDC